MKDIAIYGAGGFGKEVACLIDIINRSSSEPVWNIIGFYDDNENLRGHAISHFGLCLGGIKELNEYSKQLSVVIAIGSTSVVKRLVENISNPFISYPNLIFPTFTVLDPLSFKIGRGNIIQGGCSATCEVEIGDFNIFNGGVVIGHGVHIGSYNTFMPTVRISGEVMIGELNFFGIGSIILQQINIGRGVRLGAGSVLMTKPKDNNLYLGVPAKRTEF